MRTKIGEHLRQKSKLSLKRRKKLWNRKLVYTKISDSSIKNIEVEDSKGEKRIIGKVYKEEILVQRKRDKHGFLRYA